MINSEFVFVLVDIDFPLCNQQRFNMQQFEFSTTDFYYLNITGVMLATVFFFTFRNRIIMNLGWGCVCYGAPNDKKTEQMDKNIARRGLVR